MAIEKVLRLKAHRILSRELIKPSSTTTPPFHPQTYNLSSMDQIADKGYTPLILFYPNNHNSSLTAQHKATLLKKSLSQSLTSYYPLAGRLSAPTKPYIDCNDEGVVFLEARTDDKLDTILRMDEHDDKSLDQLFADDMVCYNSPRNTNLVGVQLNHFACGGVGLAVSLSHIIADACTLGSFLRHWASVARYGSIDHKQVLPLSPYFLHHQRTESLLPEAQVMNPPPPSNRVMKKFVFSNSSLRQLKDKVISMAAAASGVNINIHNPTRVEVLTSLLYKTAVTAATTKSGCFMPSYLFFMVNLRNNFVQKLPQTAMGNLASVMMLPTRSASETSLNTLVAEIKKEKLQFEGVESVQQAAENLKLLWSKLGNEDLENVFKRSYACSSICGFPFNKVDFGWGNPVATTIAYRSADKNGFVLMDTPDDDGIEAHVILEKEDMEIFEKDEEMLSFCKTNKN